MNKKNIARVIEKKSDIFDTRILEICFPSVGYLCNLFTPRLENIAFVKIDNSITVNLKNTSFLIIETLPSFGGTWRIHNYPGIRSDTTLYTYGYSFKPWLSKNPVATGEQILNYLNES
jgi:hypothetical protein